MQHVSLFVDMRRLGNECEWVWDACCISLFWRCVLVKKEEDKVGKTHLVCDKCKEPLNGKNFVFYLKKPYCLPCYNKIKDFNLKLP